MAVFGIIAEYNPFHNGHMYQINKIKQSGEHTVVVVMSPDVVQRGDFAMLSKFTRAKAALMCGADLVLEIPAVYALCTAEKFAYGAVKTLDALGCVDFLCFGSESGDLDSLLEAANLLDDKKVDAEIKKQLSDGKTYAKARQNAVEGFSKSASACLANPNDILAVEYIKSIKKIGSNIKPYPIIRKAVEHDSDKTDAEFASASYLRENIDELKKFVPKEALEIYKNSFENGEKSGGLKELELSLILKLRTMTLEQIKNLFDVSEGLENRIKRAANESATLEELCEKIKTKRYTMSRIRRILMYALLDIDSDAINSEIDYIRVLGHNENGLELLSKKSAKLPVITSLKRAEEISENAKKRVKIDEKISNAYSLTLENKKGAKNEFSTPIIRM